jgi:hypothetical protein
VPEEWFPWFIGAGRHGRKIGAPGTSGRQKNGDNWGFEFVFFLNFGFVSDFGF